MRSAALVDLDAITGNAALLKERVGGAELMGVVKADAYGHGLVPSAQAALRGGATWLGTAFLEEALLLRAGGVDARLLTWLQGPAEDVEPAVAAGIDLGIYDVAELARAVAAAEATGVTARLHLKVDTGLIRGGSLKQEWPDLCQATAKAQATGSIAAVGIWSHLAYAEEGPEHPVNREQLAAFTDALEVATSRGIVPEVRHLANSSAVLTAPGTYFDLVRPGAALYGLDPTPLSVDNGLRPAMTLRAEVALTKRVPAGTGVGYRHQYVTDRETTLALVPLGYADGIPRNATNVGPVLVGGKRGTVSGSVAMDQFMVDVGDAAIRAGDEVVLFGPGNNGEPRAIDWAAATGTIDYEIVTRVGARVPRVHVGGP